MQDVKKPNIADTFYIIEWNIRAVGHKVIQPDPKTREIHHREIEIVGRAISSKSASGEITTIPMELTLPMILMITIL